MTEEHHMPDHLQASRIRILPWVMLFVMLLMVASIFIPVPYYVMRPGSAVALGPIIQVEEGKKDAKGSFMLTTVRMGEANPFWYVYAHLSPDAELVEKETVLNGGSDDDFTKREQAVMQNSQKIAEAVAFRLAGYPVKVENHGVTVMGTAEGLPAKGKLQVGDVIIAVDGQKTMERTILQQYLVKKKVGETVEITFLRDEEERTESITLAEIADENGKRPGIGISLDNYQTIEIPKEVTIASKNIGGPSAGLMFTLEIYDQLKKDLDLTRGYKIAGTGTISDDGTIGRIGGINHKIVAADSAGAEIFFAPDDEGYATSNYEDAVATAKRIGTTMKIVPVKNVRDALKYLSALAPKQS